MEIANVQAVIFDMDGLMIDTEAVAFESWGHVLKTIGIEVPLAVQESMVGLTMVDSRQILIQHFGDEKQVDRVMATADEHYQATLDAGDFEVKPGLFELLDHIERLGLPKAVATSSRRKNADKKLLATGLTERFITVVTSDDVARGKPFPDLYIEAVKRLELDPAACLALEDSAPGIRSAAGAGCPVIMVPDYKLADDEDRQVASAVMGSLMDVVALFGE